MKKLRIIAIVTAVIGLAVSTYLSVAKLANKDVLCFVGASDCNIVNSSGYSMWRGIPVAILGVLGYVLILAILLILSKQKNESSVIMLALFSVTLFGMLYSLYLTYVEIFIIHAICPWCLTSATAMFVLFIISAIFLGRSKILTTIHQEE
jgi:uncharacterized membrane protein